MIKMTEPVVGDLASIDEARWPELVDALLDGNGSRIVARRCEETLTGAGAGTRIYRVTGTARDHRGPIDWSLVVKFLSLDVYDYQIVSTDQHAWNYWKREWHAYRAPWQQQLAGPFVAARCLGTGDAASPPSEGEVAWIAMEDLADNDVRPWSTTQFRTVAQDIGRFNGAFLTGQALSSDPWLSRQWIRNWTEQATPMLALLSDASLQPAIEKIFPPDVISDLTQLWERRETLCDVLDQLPQTLCHNDVFPRNVFLRPSLPDRSVAIDWAFCGTGAVGQELGPLVGASLAFFESRPGCWDDLERVCLDGYTEGLRAAGWSDTTDEVLLGYLLSSTLHFGLGALTPILGVTLDEAQRPVVEQIFGCSFETFVHHMAAVMRFQQRRIRQAFDVLGI
jgi:hypothetical protein